MICNHCNKRIWFWQGKIYNHNTFYTYHISCSIYQPSHVTLRAQQRAIDLQKHMHDTKLVNTNKRRHVGLICEERVSMAMDALNDQREINKQIDAIVERAGAAVIRAPKRKWFKL